MQNVEPLPFQTALKYTVAKYYTPSGACFVCLSMRMFVRVSFCVCVSLSPGVYVCVDMTAV